MFNSRSHASKSREWLIEYLNARSTQVPITGCLLWLGPAKGNGYGQKSINGKHKLVHRIAYELAKGPIPTGLVIDHLCRVRCCINPDHLEAVTEHENIRRGVSPTAPLFNLTHCLKGHEFTVKTSYIDRRGKRSCRICNAARERKYYHARALATDDAAIQAAVEE